jgi:hypothetical protein
LPSEVKSDSINDIGSNSDLQPKDHIKSMVQTRENGSVMSNKVTSSDWGQIENLHGAAEQSAMNSEKPIDREKISTKVAVGMQTLENSSNSEITNYNTTKATQSPKTEQSPEEVMIIETQQNSAAATGSLLLELEEKKTVSDDGEKRAVEKDRGLHQICTSLRISN